MVVTDITERLKVVRDRIAVAAANAGRDPATIRILAVSKRQSPAAIAALAEAGINDFAESYVQEAAAKLSAVKHVTWHFIGQVQSNKTRFIAESFDWVESVVRERIARRLDEQRPHHAPALNVCIQVRIDPRDSRPGVDPEDVPAMAATIAGCPRLCLRGLMGMPPAGRSAQETARSFRSLSSLFESIRKDHPSVDTLSMGMSGDLEIAIAEGATQLRIGTALFGLRSD